MTAQIERAVGQGTNCYSNGPYLANGYQELCCRRGRMNCGCVVTGYAMTATGRETINHAR
jgi:hypothetical protein